MTPQMQVFLRELADLLQKHDVRVETVEDAHIYNRGCLGIEFYIPGKWDEEGEAITENCCVRTSNYPGPDELRALANPPPPDI